MVVYDILSIDGRRVSPCRLGICKEAANYYYNYCIVDSINFIVADKTYNTIISLYFRVNLDIKAKLAIYDSLVVAIILYRPDIWGIYGMI